VVSYVHSETVEVKVDLHGGLVVLDEVGGDVVFVEVFTAVGSMSWFDVVIASKPLDYRLSHMHSPDRKHHVHWGD